MKALLLFIAFIIFTSCKPTRESDNKVSTPVMGETSWKICTMPDLGELNGPDPERQHIVDHGIIQAENGEWLLWACIRGTAVGRLLYGWKGHSIEEGPWEELGVAARADTAWGEGIDPEKMQAPHFFRTDTAFLCFYNSSGIRLMTSRNGLDYRRLPINEGTNLLYSEGGRDPMALVHEGKVFVYSTISTVARDGWRYGFIIVRTSENLKRWSDYTIVNSGGIGGNGAISAESPFVIKKDGIFYLFRSSSITGRCYVYASDNPYDFGVNHDNKLITTLPIKAPELIKHNDQWYISDLDDFNGVMIRKLTWE